MRWSSIVKKDQPSDVQTEVSVLEFSPRQFEISTPEAAIDYLQQKSRGSDFVMSDVLRKTTGVEEIEKQSEEQKIEQKVLEKLATVQEEAYQQAYKLGLEQGHAKAYEEKKSAMEEQLQSLISLSASLNNIKQELVYQNEAHLIRLVYDIASRIAFDHIEENHDSVVQVIKKAIEQAQADEHINVLISPLQAQLVESLKQDNSKETEFLKRVKFEPSDKVSLGSCIVETNYGVVDASVEERVQKLWTELKQSIPKVKSPVEPT